MCPDIRTFTTMKYTVCSLHINDTIIDTSIIFNKKKIKTKKKDAELTKKCLDTIS